MLIEVSSRTISIFGAFVLLIPELIHQERPDVLLTMSCGDICNAVDAIQSTSEYQSWINVAQHVQRVAPIQTPIPTRSRYEMIGKRQVTSDVVSTGKPKSHNGRKL